ncbi:MAG: acyclic terpene utilization AtuA family protein [Burkholderiaceae bacterium]
MKSVKSSPTLAVGCGAGFSGDRVDAPGPVVRTLVERGGPAVMIFEMLAERTLATAQLARRANPELGYEVLLDLVLRPILGDCINNGITIIGNFGAANPRGAASMIQRLAAELGLPAPRIAVVEGDDLSSGDCRTIVREALAGDFDEHRFVCANAYQGAFAIADAITSGAQVVVTGRVADPSLTVGPAIAHFGWTETDWDQLAGATMAGHLLECGAQVSGGYFADPGYKEVPGLDDVGFPIAEIAADGSCIVTKAANTGGLVDARTVKEQLLYEVHDPAMYLTPDVVADFSDAEVAEVGRDRVRLTGVRGHPRTPTLKANIFFDGGWLGEGEISYAGAGAEARARQAMDVMQKRVGRQLKLRFDLIGVVSVLGDDTDRLLHATAVGAATDVRLRVAAKHEDSALIDRMLRELTALWTGGPAGGGGVRVNKRQRLSLKSCLVPREKVPASFAFV